MPYSWVEIDLNAITHNLTHVKTLLKPETKLMAVVKADAYGHGLVEVAKTVSENGADFLAVAQVEEGKTLREMGITTPILILGATFSEDFPDVIKYNLTPSIASFGDATILDFVAEKFGKVIPVHIKVDTGLNRYGVRFEEALELIQKISHLKNIKIEGVFTHFASSDSEDLSFTFAQLNKFSSLVADLKEKGFQIPLFHCCNSLATLRLPNFHFDMVRVGRMLYGLTSTLNLSEEKYLKPALSLKSRVALVKEVRASETIGYGRTFTTEKQYKVAVVTIGYADGVSRALSNVGEVLVGGERAKILGRISMDQMVVNVTEIPQVKIGDEVVIIGEQEGNRVTTSELARLTNTIDYEILTGIGYRVKRVYKNCEYVVSLPSRILFTRK